MLKVFDRPEAAPNDPEDRGLTARQEAAAALLAGGLTVAEASRRGKVGTTTLKRWAKESAFARRVTALRAEATTAAVGRLVASMTSAADTHWYLARKGKQEAVRLSARLVCPTAQPMPGLTGTTPARCPRSGSG